MESAKPFVTPALLKARLPEYFKRTYSAAFALTAQDSTNRAKRFRPLKASMNWFEAHEYRLVGHFELPDCWRGMIEAPVRPSPLACFSSPHGSIVGIAFVDDVAALKATKPLQQLLREQRWSDLLAALKPAGAQPVVVEFHSLLSDGVHLVTTNRPNPVALRTPIFLDRQQMPVSTDPASLLNKHLKRLRARIKAKHTPSVMPLYSEAAIIGLWSDTHQKLRAHRISLDWVESDELVDLGLYDDDALKVAAAVRATMAAQAEVNQAEVVKASVVQAQVTQAEVVQAAVTKAELTQADLMQAAQAPLKSAMATKSGTKATSAKAARPALQQEAPQPEAPSQTAAPMAAPLPPLPAVAAPTRAVETPPIPPVAVIQPPTPARHHDTDAPAPIAASAESTEHLKEAPQDHNTVSATVTENPPCQGVLPAAKPASRWVAQLTSKWVAKWASRSAAARHAAPACADEAQQDASALVAPAPDAAASAATSSSGPALASESVSATAAAAAAATATATTPASASISDTPLPDLSTPSVQVAPTTLRAALDAPASSAVAPISFEPPAGDAGDDQWNPDTQTEPLHLPLESALTDLMEPGLLAPDLQEPVVLESDLLAPDLLAPILTVDEAPAILQVLPVAEPIAEPHDEPVAEQHHDIGPMMLPVASEAFVNGTTNADSAIAPAPVISPVLFDHSMIAAFAPLYDEEIVCEAAVESNTEAVTDAATDAVIEAVTSVETEAVAEEVPLAATRSRTQAELPVVATDIVVPVFAAAEAVTFTAPVIAVAPVGEAALNKAVAGAERFTDTTDADTDASASAATATNARARTSNDDGLGNNHTEETIEAALQSPTTGTGTDTADEQPTPSTAPDLDLVANFEGSLDDAASLASDMLAQFDPSLSLQELAQLGLAQGAIQIEAVGRPMHPMLIDELGRFHALLNDQGNNDPMTLAKSVIWNTARDIRRAALVLDAKRQFSDGRKSDAIVVMVCERGVEAGEIWAQRYHPKSLFKKFRLEGEPEVIGQSSDFISQAMRSFEEESSPA